LLQLALRGWTEFHETWIERNETAESMRIKTTKALESDLKASAMYCWRILTKQTKEVTAFMMLREFKVQRLFLLEWKRETQILQQLQLFSERVTTKAIKHTFVSWK